MLNFSFPLTVTNYVPHEAQRPETAPEEKAASNTRLNSLSPSLRELNFFFPSSPMRSPKVMLSF